MIDDLPILTAALAGCAKKNRSTARAEDIPRIFKMFPWPCLGGQMTILYLFKNVNSFGGKKHPPERPVDWVQTENEYVDMYVLTYLGTDVRTYNPTTVIMHWAAV